MMRALAAAGLVAALSAGCSFGLGSPEAEEESPSASSQQGVESSDGGDEQGASSGPSDGGGAEDSAAEDSGDAVIDEDAAAVGVDLTGVGEPIATAEAPATVKGDESATMTVSLHSLTRRDGTLVGTYSFRVEASQAGSDDPQDLYDYLGGDGWHPFAVDTTNLNRHDVMSSGGRDAASDYMGQDFRPGQTFYAFAVFAAPPEDVTTMDVALVDGAPMATEVPIR